MIFDTHAHYNDEAFAGDLAEVVAKFPEAGIEKAVNVASDLESIGQVLDLAKKYPFFYSALGIHPSDCGPLDEEKLENIQKHLHDPKVLAVGEIGLDYHWPEPERSLQQYWFARQLQMAEEAGLPVIIHSREAAEDTLRILKENHAENIGGVVHCFSYSPEIARECVKLGFYIGIGGVVTFKNGKKMKEVVRTIPKDRIVMETDCPYLAPTPHRGERNSSLYLPLVAKEIAQLLDMTLEDVIEMTRENGERLYRMR